VQSAVRFLARRARLGQRRGVVSPSHEILHAADAEARQRRIAGGLLAAGVVRGDRVALTTTSGADMICAILGALRVGMIPVMTHSGLLEAERAALLDDAQPAMVVDDAALASLVCAPPTDLAPWPLARPMHYTSGTTGTPKGVFSGVLDEHEAAALLAEEVEQWGFDAHDRHLVCSPFHHSVSIRFAGGTLLSGGSVILPGPFDATTVANAIADTAPNTTFMVPAHMQRLFALPALPDLGGFRLVAHAGAPCPEHLKRTAMAAFGDDVVWEFYGATEGQFTACSPSDWQQRPGTVGRARAGREMTADPDGTLWCSVPRWSRFQYWRDPQRTSSAWRQATTDPDAFGSFSVGDLGRVDDDGYVWLDGRRDDLIITGGVNVYPAEVEKALAGAPGVDDVAVFGVDDPHWGQAVWAAVVGDANFVDLDAWARTHLAGHKRPKRYHRLDALPHTATGKLQRSALTAVLGIDGGQ
jgi:acyl-CoA synthetase (AMP-forming)/AMP-acid ligase II